MMMRQTTTERIMSKPDVCGGSPCIAGTQDVYVWHELQGLSTDEIVSRIQHISMGDVYAALSYWDHRDEILKQLQEESEFVARMKQKHSSPLQEKLAQKNAQNHSIPS